MNTKLDRQRYLDIYKTQGLPAAITAIHRKMWEIENECFEGTSGFRPELYETLREYRDFSKELWDLREIN